MLKPKNISIKKITEPDSLENENKKNKNSRKSLKIPRREPSQSNNPSPINIMKEDTNFNDSESDHGNFIKYINGYLNQLDSDKGQSKSRNTEKSEIQMIKRKIHKEKEINRNMQRNIVEFQRILLQRTEKLDMLEEYMRRIQAKENDRNLSNYNSHAKSRQKLLKRLELPQISSQFEHFGSEFSENETNQQNYYRYKQRRKTEIPGEIQRMISKTMALRPQRSKQKF